MTMVNYPEINPIAVDLGIIKVHWYGLMYFFAFILFIQLGKYKIKNHPNPSNLNEKILDDLFFYGALGVVLGGRLGYVLFYQPGYYFSNPFEIFAVWQGGMSFHGGLLGVIGALIFIANRYKKKWLELTDFVAPLVPLGLGLGRLGNFINQELWGRPTDIAWAMIFPNVDSIPRHPSQLYQFFLEGILLFFILWTLSRKQRKIGYISGLFLILYGFFRIAAEFFREPDSHIGLLMNFFSFGQILCIPMVLVGIYLIKPSNND